MPLQLGLCLGRFRVFRGVGQSFGRVCGAMRRVPRHMRGGCGVAGSAGRGTGRRMAGFARRVMRRKRRRARRGHADFAAHPIARGFDRPPWPQVPRPLRLEAGQSAFGAIRRP